MTDLATTYLGLELANPVVASASPLTERLDTIRQMEDAGAAAIVMHSLFEEQLSIEAHDFDHYLSHGAEMYAEAQSYFPDMVAYNRGLEAYVEHLRRAVEATDVPIVASLNGVSPGGWTSYARHMEEAGAAAIELNTYFLPADPATSSAQVEQMYVDVVREVTQAVSIPVAVKLSPFLTAPGHLIGQLAQVGARGAVLFNRFYQPELDIEALEVTARVRLSTPLELPMRLRWVCLLHGKVDVDLAVTGGVHQPEHVVQCMMAGARVAMMTSALLRHGVPHLRAVIEGLRRWMEEHEYTSIRQMQGSMSQGTVAEPAALERAQYMRVLRAYRVTSPLRGDDDMP